jgi:hypothetical protein
VGRNEKLPPIATPKARAGTQAKSPQDLFHFFLVPYLVQYQLIYNHSKANYNKLQRNSFDVSCRNALVFPQFNSRQSNPINHGKMKYPIGTKYSTRGKHPRLCTVTDIWKTYDSKGDLVRKRYVATHDMLGQTVTDRDVVEVTIARGVQALKEKQAFKQVGQGVYLLTS